MYERTDNLFEIIDRSFRKQLFPWDEYFPAMAQTDFLAGRGNINASKSFFIRETPFGGGYAVLGGITAALHGISKLDFNDSEFQYRMRYRGYKDSFLECLKKKERLRLNVCAPREGDLFFANEPVISVSGPVIDIRLVEGILGEALNFPSLAITKWSRFVRAVAPGYALDFSRRRAQNPDKSTLYGLLAGCYGTSNSEMARFIECLLLRTMGHEWPQSFGDVERSFDVWLTHNPHKPIAIVDTKQCLAHDYPIWLDMVWKHREAIKNANPAIWGGRNDSNDLTDISIQQYRIFNTHPLSKDAWFNERMRILLTNDLDEYSASSIIQQIKINAGADAEDIIKRIVWAAGTKPGTCYDQPSLNGVAKLMSIEDKACIKLAFNDDGQPNLKTSIPGFNFSAYIRDVYGNLQCVLCFPRGKYMIIGEKLFLNGKKLQTVKGIHPDNPNAIVEIFNYEAILKQKLVYSSILDNTGFTDEWDNPTISDVSSRIQNNVDRLPSAMTRFTKPKPMKVYLTPDLYNLRNRMIQYGALREDELPE